MSNPYIYTPLYDGADIHLAEETPACLRYLIEIPSALSPVYLGNNRIIGEYILPQKHSRVPLAILVHGMGARNETHCRLLAQTMAQKGIASFILYLVFHNRRAPEWIKNKYPNLSLEEWFESYQISVTDIRQVIDWASARPEIIQNKILVAGISFGAFVSTISMGLDPRIKAGIFILSGGNSEKITRHSLLLRHQYKIKPAEYRRNQEMYQQYLAEVAEKGFDNVVAGKISYLTDPLTFARFRDNRPVLMLNALLDEMIPRNATMELWQAYEKPPIAWYPATHASIWVWYHLMSRKICGFLNSVFPPGNQ